MGRTDGVRHEPPRIPESDVVDDLTYDLLQALTSSLEALDAYREYASNAPGSVFEELIGAERRQATDLLEALRLRLAS